MLLHSIDELNGNVAKSMDLYNGTRKAVITELQDAAVIDAGRLMDRLNDNPAINNGSYGDELEFIETKIEYIKRQVVKALDPIREFYDRSEFAETVHKQINELGKLDELMNDKQKLHDDTAIVKAPKRLAANCEYIKNAAAKLPQELNNLAESQIQDAADDLEFATKLLRRRLADMSNDPASDEALSTLDMIVQNVDESIIAPLMDGPADEYRDIKDEFNALLDVVIETAEDMQRQVDKYMAQQ